MILATYETDLYLRYLHKNLGCQNEQHKIYHKRRVKSQKCKNCLLEGEKTNENVLKREQFTWESS